TGTCLEEAVFSTAERTPWCMRSQSLNRAILVSIVHHRTIVATEYNKGVISQPFFFERFDKFTDHSIGFHNHITPRTHIGRSNKPGMRCTRDMRLLESIIKEE